MRHPNLVHVYRHYVVDETLIYIEMEAPSTASNWKSFCKRAFTDQEIIKVFEALCGAVEFLHGINHIHRDIHPSRLHLLGHTLKFNHIGMPFNFKKLLKRDNFCGHINYSAPEMILDSPYFSNKCDIWALGCCLY